MKNRRCPIKESCFGYVNDSCEGCPIGEKITKLCKSKDCLKTENLKLKAENEELKSRINILLNPSF